MTDRMKVRFARESDANAIEAFARRRVTWLREHDISVDWAGIIPAQAHKTASDIPGKDWRVFVVVADDRPVGRVVAWIEPPTDPKNGDHRPRIGTVGLTGLCTDPDTPGAARAPADWSAHYAGSLGLNDVRLPTTVDRLAEYYPKLGFMLDNTLSLPKAKTLWEFTRPAA
jgi:hypothetical protein